MPPLPLHMYDTTLENPFPALDISSIATKNGDDGIGHAGLDFLILAALAVRSWTRPGRWWEGCKGGGDGGAAKGFHGWLLIQTSCAGRR
jgi:hypothetical protein